MLSFNPECLFEVINTLLGPSGCPWDKEQTPQSLCDYLIEEMYELVEAVRNNEINSVKEELGDVFFLLCFLVNLLEQKGTIDLQDVFDSSASKMIRRHPHVFQDIELHNREELHKKWEEIKLEEKRDQGLDEEDIDPLDSIPVPLPPLMKAYRINSKAAKAGFTWESNADQEASLNHEWQEWIRAVHSDDQNQKEEEFGDVLFSLVEQGRRRGIKADSALQKACQKFFQRWKSMHRRAKDKGLKWEILSLEEKNRLWEEVKSEPEKTKD